MRMRPDTEPVSDIKTSRWDFTEGSVFVSGDDEPFEQGHKVRTPGVFWMLVNERPVLRAAAVWEPVALRLVQLLYSS